MTAGREMRKAEERVKNTTFNAETAEIAERNPRILCVLIHRQAQDDPEPVEGSAALR